MLSQKKAYPGIKLTPMGNLAELTQQVDSYGDREARVAARRAARREARRQERIEARRAARRAARTGS